jgi:predicted metallopeptidase
MMIIINNTFLRYDRVYCNPEKILSAEMKPRLTVFKEGLQYTPVYILELVIYFIKLSVKQYNKDRFGIFSILFKLAKQFTTRTKFVI